MGVLSKQTIDFSVPNPSATPQFSLPLYQGAGYREDFQTWSLLHSGGFMRFNLNVSKAIPVDLTLTLCASLVGGVANCPITIAVNTATLFRSYSDHNANWHDQTFVIPQDMLHPGDNAITLSLDVAATTQIFVKAATVDQAVLREQTIDFSVPNPVATAQLSMPLYQGAGYRPDFRTWSLLVNNGYMKFNLDVATPVPVNLTLGLCASLVQGKADCPISIMANGKSVVKGYRDTDCNFHRKSFTISADCLIPGKNDIVISLDGNASTQMFINAVTVSGE